MNSAEAGQFWSNLDDDVGLGDVLLPSLPGELAAAKLSADGKTFGLSLVRRPTLQDALLLGVVDGVEPAQQPFEVAMGMDGDTQHLALDAAIATPDHTIIRHDALDVSADLSGIGAMVRPSGTWGTGSTQVRAGRRLYHGLALLKPSDWASAGRTSEA